jgi:hypothetical protein
VQNATLLRILAKNANAKCKTMQQNATPKN